MKDLNCYAELRHINLRKEGPDDDKTPAFDLKLEAMVPAEFVENLMLGDGEENGSVVAAFWSEDGEPKFLSLEKVAIDRQVHNVMGTVEGLELRACKLKGFSFKPRGNKMAELTFQASSNDFPSNAASVLAELLHEQVGVSMKAPQGDLFADGEQPGPAVVEGVDGPDPLYENAVECVRLGDACSIARLQRALKIGYNRAARLVERMESEGIVSAADDQGVRHVLATQQ